MNNTDQFIVFVNIMPVEGDKTDTIHGKIFGHATDGPDMCFQTQIGNFFLCWIVEVTIKIRVFPFFLTKFKFDVENRLTLALDPEQLLVNK